jgi:hypothetical protein
MGFRVGGEEWEWEREKGPGVGEWRRVQVWVRRIVWGVVGIGPIS